MKKILLSLLAFIGLGLFSFSSAGYFTESNTLGTFDWSNSGVNLSLFNYGDYVCLDSTESNFNVNGQFFTIHGKTCLEYTSSINSISWSYGQTATYYKLEYNDGTCGSSCDYSEYEQCLNDLGNYSSSLNMCYYDLGNCRAGICSGDYLSNLFINNIQYPGNNNLYVNIPDGFDYSYNMSGDYSDIDIEYKLDADYIEGIIEVQNYKPTSEDFTKLVLMLAPYSKYLLFILFAVIVWAWIKKPFKSKKL